MGKLIKENVIANIAFYTYTYVDAQSMTRSSIDNNKSNIFESQIFKTSCWVNVKSFFNYFLSYNFRKLFLKDKYNHVTILHETLQWIQNIFQNKV